MPYNGTQIAIEDRETLCRGLCVVIASLPAEQLDSALHKLAQPIISCLNVTAKEAESYSNHRASILQRVANEIRLLASVVKHFVHTDALSRFDLLSALMQKSWQDLIFIGESSSSEEVRNNCI
jgi:hypothetical protein